MAKVSDDSLLEILQHRHNDREVALYFVKKAKDAASAASVATTAGNHLAVVAAAAEMGQHITMLYKLLANDKTNVDENKK